MSVNLSTVQAQFILKALKGQHDAIDILLAMVIVRDESFRPTQSRVWPAVTGGHEAIKLLEASARRQRRPADPVRG